MRSPIAIVVLAIVQVGYLLTLWLSREWLPLQVASHFDAAGWPNDWTSRTTYLWTMAGIALAVSTVLLVLFYSIRVFPVSMVNIPRREYWLAPERRRQTLDYLLSAGVWLATLEIALFWIIHLLIVQAHTVQPVRLSPIMWLPIVGFVLVTLIWTAMLMRRFFFRLPPHSEIDSPS